MPLDVVEPEKYLAKMSNKTFEGWAWKLKHKELIFYFEIWQILPDVVKMEKYLAKMSNTKHFQRLALLKLSWESLALEPKTCFFYSSLFANSQHRKSSLNWTGADF